jgi:hypothetical protein
LTNTTSILDFSLQPAQTFIISGTVSEIESGSHLLAQVLIEGESVSTWTDSTSGFYQLELPQGDYTLMVMADHYRYQQVPVTVDQDQTIDFNMELLGCILLVDDDQNDPDVQSNYADTLDLIGIRYDVWDIAAMSSPTEQDLSGYPTVVWFTGSARSTTLYTQDETFLTSYLDSGGNLFLSSQDYLFDKGLTSFGEQYLGVSDFVSDVGQLDVVGLNVFTGLGPYHLFFPFTDYSDMLISSADAQVAFSGNTTDPAVSLTGDGFKTVFLAFPFEATGQLEDRAAIVSRMMVFFGGCEHPQVLIDPLAIDIHVASGQSASTSFWVQNTGSGQLTFTITDTQSVSWFSFSPSSGSLLPSSGQQVRMIIDASLLQPGTYTTALQISSTSVDQPVIQLPITITVVNPSHIIRLPVVIKQ